MRALILLFAFAASATAAEPYWNQYRGPYANGWTDAKGLPLEFSETKNVAWKIPLDGKAWSSPVVWDDQIWLTNATPDGKKMWAVCVEVASGKILHNLLLLENEKPDFCHPVNSYASCTPFLEEDRAYIHFGKYGTFCLDRKTGETIWSRTDLECNHFRGPGSSPIVYNGMVYLHFDGYDQQYVVALDKETGKTIWKKHRAFDYGTDNGDLKKAYCTPNVIEHSGRKMLISPAAIATEAFDPKTGDLLWTVHHGGMNASARPLFGQGLLFITNGMGKMVAVRPEGSGDITKSAIAWSGSRGVSKKASQLLVGDLLYQVSDKGIASAVEAKTGETVWQERLGGNFAASPIYSKGDNRIYFCSESGEVSVIEPGREFKLLAKNKLDGGFMATPAPIGNSLILRTRTHLYRVTAE